MKLAAALMLVAPDAIVSRAGGAGFAAADSDLQRRHERTDEIELTDRADILAETRAAEECVHREGGHEITYKNPGGEVRAVPEVERLIGPEEQDEKADGEPLGAQRVRPVSCCKPQPAPQFARQRERASHAEEIPGCQQRHDDDRAAVRPGEHAGKIHRSHRVAEETVRDHRNGNNQQDRLQRAASIPGAEQ